MDVTEGNILVGDINATLTNDPVLSTGIECNALKLAGKWSQLSSSQLSLQELTSTHLNQNGVPSHSSIQNVNWMNVNWNVNVNSRKCGKYHKMVMSILFKFHVVTFLETFFLNFGRRKVFSVEPLISLFWISGDVCPGLQSQGGSLACVLSHLHSTSIDEARTHDQKFLRTLNFTLYKYLRNQTQSELFKIYILSL